MAVIEERQTKQRKRRAPLRIADLQRTPAYHELMSWDLTSVIDHVQADTKAPTELLVLAAVEYRRFLALRLAGWIGLTASGLVARVWQAHTLFTADYSRMCEAIGTFVHHRPIASGPVAARGVRVTSETYFALYGEAPDAKVWNEGPFGCATSTPGYESDGSTTDEETD